MLLSEAKTRVAKGLDDVDADKYDLTEISDGLRAAQGEAWVAALEGALDYLKTTATPSSSSAGVVDMSAFTPRQLLSVSYVLSTQFMVVMPMRMEQAPIAYPSAQPLSIRYIPDVAFPIDDAHAFVWGGATVMPSVAAQLDALTVMIATRDLKTKSGEKLPGLDDVIAQKKQAIIDSFPSASWSAVSRDEMAGRGRTKAPFQYIETGPHTLQLVLSPGRR